MTSRWHSIWEERERQWLRLEDLEQRIDESAMRKRRRLANLLDETPTHRRSRLRLFCTHSILPPQPAPSPPAPVTGQSSSDPSKSKPEQATPSVTPDVSKTPSKSNETWKLLIEGKLLVGHLDHKSAAKVEQEAAEAAGVDPASVAQSGVPGNDTGVVPNTSNPAGADAQPLVRSTDRTQYRGISEKEGDEPVHPIVFTHFFDSMSVTFQTIYQPPHPASVAVEAKTPKKGRGKKRSKQVDPAVWEEERLKRLLTSSPPTEITWKRQNQTDTNAFVVEYSPPPPSSSDDLIQHSVIATIRLYPRPSPEESQYKPSPALADALFSKNASQDGDGDGRRRRKPASAKKRKRIEADEEHGVKSDAAPEPPKEIATENDIVVPKTLLLKEIVSCIFMYAEHKELLDPNDRSSIINDKVLSSLFECERMNFAELQQRLLDRKLITKANDSPVVLTYVMKKDNVSISPFDQMDEKTLISGGKGEINGSQQSAISSKDKDQDDDEDVGPSCLSLDIDVNVPGLFHYRVRELMRRIKRREFEYTSSRTKARNMLVTSRATEDAVKTRIEEAVCGRGYTPDHIPVWLALARAAPAGSEARAAAQIDARTCALLGKLYEHCAAAKAAWSVVDACQQTTGDV